MRQICALLFLAIFWTSTAGAATTDVENVLDPTVHPYQQFGSASCTFAGDCSIVFPKLTAAQTLIQHASCSFALATGGSIGFASLGSQNANPRNEFPAFANASTSGVTNYGINADTYLFVATADQPRIDVFGVGAVVQNLICTVSGYYR
jgi:hypothetical protein